ncbi:hypothetical protein F910_03973 [Acinetobacter baumannii NIPH 410]|nr:hypothetical protein F910_03973 [Acinetobacter baumannii NIPH 410]
MGQSGGGQGVEPTGIAIRHRRPHRTTRFDPLAVRFQQQMRHACQTQRSTQQQPDFIRPTDDHMVAQRPRPLGDFAFFGLRWLTECARAAECPRPTVMVSDQERRQPHAQHQRDQHRLHHVGGNQVLLHDHAQEQQRKLAAMPQHDACAPGVERRQAGCAQRQKVQPHLERHQGQQPAQYSQTTLLFIQDSKKTRNNSSTESINHSLRLRLTHAHICSIGFKSGLYAGSQRILCPCCSNNS